MIKRKKKECTSCGDTQYIFGRGMCSRCYRIVVGNKGSFKKTKPIKKVASKRARQLRAYKPKRDLFLYDNPICQAPGCGNPSTELHHAKGRENDLLLEKKYWVALCHGCHRRFTDDSKLAIELGVSVSRLSNLK